MVATRRTWEASSVHRDASELLPSIPQCPESLGFILRFPLTAKLRSPLPYERGGLCRRVVGGIVGFLYSSQAAPSCLFLLEAKPKFCM